MHVAGRKLCRHQVSLLTLVHSSCLPTNVSAPLLLPSSFGGNTSRRLLLQSLYNIATSLFKSLLPPQFGQLHSSQLLPYSFRDALNPLLCEAMPPPPLDPRVSFLVYCFPWHPFSLSLGRRLSFDCVPLPFRSACPCGVCLTWFHYF